MNVEFGGQDLADRLGGRVQREVTQDVVAAREEIGGEGIRGLDIRFALKQAVRCLQYRVDPLADAFVVSLESFTASYCSIQTRPRKKRRAASSIWLV